MCLKVARQEAGKLAGRLLKIIQETCESCNEGSGNVKRLEKFFKAGIPKTWWTCSGGRGLRVKGIREI